MSEGRENSWGHHGALTRHQRRADESPSLESEGESRRKGRSRKDDDSHHGRRRHSRGETERKDYPRRYGDSHHHQRRHSRDSRRSRSRTRVSSSLYVSPLSESFSQIGAAMVAGLDRLVEKRIPGVSNLSIVANIIPIFDPLLHDVDQWVNSVNEFALIYGWDDKTTSHLALSKLRGTAEMWFNGLPTRLFTWKEWYQMLQEKFKIKRDLNKLIQELMSCKPQVNEALYEYVFRKMALMHKLKIPINDEDRVNLIMGGIDDVQIKFTVEAANIKDPHVLANHFRLLDSTRNISDKTDRVLGKSGPSSTRVNQPSGSDRNRAPLCYR